VRSKQTRFMHLIHLICLMYRYIYVTDDEIISSIYSLEDKRAHLLKKFFLPFQRQSNISLTAHLPLVLYVPNKLKIAKVIPIFKSGDSSDVNNYRYRPISLLIYFSKISEKIVHKRLVAYRLIIISLHHSSSQ
jgi:hypothetical protein